MPKVTEMARDKFRDLFYYGTCVEFNQSEMQETIDQNANAEGVCFELARRWCFAVLTDGDDFDATNFRDVHYSLSKGEMTELIRVHKTRGRVDSENFVVDGATRDRLVTRRKKGKLPAMFRKVILRDREAILQQMWNNPGVYLYGFKGHGGGHVVGFEFKQNSRIRFFDPNLGLYEVPGWSETLLEQFRKFFSYVWDFPWQGGSYKHMARLTWVADKHRVLSRVVLNDA